MIAEAVNTWDDFLNNINNYLTLPYDQRNGYLFRGHASAKWKIETTLSRFCKSAKCHDTKLAHNLSLAYFDSECVRIDGNNLHRSHTDRKKLEMLARHHGLPTNILDWTGSPYVAAYFAFSDPIHNSSEHSPEHCAIYTLNMKAFDICVGSSAKLLDEQIDVVSNDSVFLNSIRPAEQVAYYMKTKDPDIDIQVSLKDYLHKLIIPSCERSKALSHLDEMGFNERSLFRDYDSAARTAKWRALDQLIQEDSSYV